MERLLVLMCLGLIVQAAAEVNPRGSRPVEPGTRSEKCAVEKDWPFCTDDDWGPKCPSGCRIQGLMDKNDHSLLKRIEKIRSILDQNRVRHRTTDQVSKQTYDYLKDKLTIDADNDNNFYDLAQNLRQRINDMKIKIDRQLRILAALKDRVKDQVVEMQKLEVDIDIKLRSCKGSCSSYSGYEVDKESYVVLDKQISQLDSHSTQSIESVRTLYVMKSKPMETTTVEYKSGPGVTKSAQQTVDMFTEVKNMELVLEEEGSKTSPATVSKDSGTSYSSSSSSSSSSSTVSSSSSSSKSITELSGSKGGSLGGGFEALSQPSTTHVTTSSVSCVKTTKKTIVHTKTGPVEKVEEVMEGGPECKTLTDFTKGGLGSLFPSLTQSSSSSSSSSSITSKTVHTGGAKGSLTTSSTTELGDPFSSDIGLDLGAFLTDDAEDDVPDFHARGLKTARVERQADYVGKDCVDAHQKHLKGEINGLFKIKPGGADTAEVVEVYCQQEGLMGGWLLVQQRESGALSFNRTWAEYRSGFGSVDAQGKGEFWLGNQNLHLLTNQGETMLRVELEDWEGGVANAEYTVSVGPEEEGFPLHVSAYTGDAGDALVTAKTDQTSYPSHNGMKFSTFDKDGDTSELNCAEMYGGGWWYSNCQAANLNGVYYKGTYEMKEPFRVLNGVTWVTYKPENYSLKTVRMFIRPATF